MAVYVGESDNVQRRFGNYRQGSEGQVTSRRINGWLKQLLAEQGEISISAVTDTAWFVDGADATRADLSSKSVRRLFEQWAITASLRPGIQSLNVIDEDAVPDTYWSPGTPRLRRELLVHDLKMGEEIAGVALSDPQPFLTVRTR